MATVAARRLAYHGAAGGPPCTLEIMLKGYSTPLSPEGRANLVPAPPWHYAGDIFVIEFRTSPDAAAAVLPPGLEPGRNIGACVAFFADWQAAAASREELLDPVRAQYHEFFVLVSAEHRGEPVMTCPYIFVDQDVSLVRGLIQGYPKVLGSIHMTRTFDVEGLASPGLAAGAVFGGTLAVKGRRLVEAALTLEAPSPQGPALAPIVNLRYYPSLDGGGPAVAELVRGAWDNRRVSTVWKGGARLRFFESPCHELHRLAPLEVSAGYRFSMALTIRGVEHLADVRQHFAR